MRTLCRLKESALKFRLVKAAGHVHKHWRPHPCAPLLSTLTSHPTPLSFPPFFTPDSQRAQKNPETENEYRMVVCGCDPEIRIYKGIREEGGLETVWDVEEDLPVKHKGESLSENEQ